MSCRLLSKLWTFCHRIFSTRLPWPAGISAKCGHFVTRFLDICDVLPPAQQTIDMLSQDLWKNTDCAVRRKKAEISWDSPFKWHVEYFMSRQSCAFNIKLIHSPLRIHSHTWKWAEMGKFFGKMDFLLRWDKMSQHSYMKNMQTKCHRLWDKILQWDGLSRCEKP